MLKRNHCKIELITERALAEGRSHPHNHEYAVIMPMMVQEVYMLARHGEGHVHLPADVNYRANIYAFKVDPVSSAHRLLVFFFYRRIVLDRHDLFVFITSRNLTTIGRQDYMRISRIICIRIRLPKKKSKLDNSFIKKENI